MVDGARPEQLHFDIRKFSSTDGIFAENMGKVYMTEKSWHVVTYIDLQNFEDNFMFAENTFIELTNMCREIGLVNYLNGEQTIVLSIQKLFKRIILQIYYNFISLYYSLSLKINLYVHYNTISYVTV